VAKSAAVESPATETRRKLHSIKRRAARYRSWATAIENGKAAGVAIALRALADRLERKER
jgi:hypothetical protein